jgi:hypothetical protein
VLGTFVLLGGSVAYGPDRELANLCPSCALALGYGSSSTVNKFGFNGDVDQTEESIWDADDLPTEGDGPARCFTNIAVDTPKAIYVSSDDAADAGLGIEIEVLDATWARSMVAMNLGIAAATTGTVYTQVGSATLLRVNRAFATGDAFTGNIYVHIDGADDGTDGVPDTPATHTIAVITAGEEQTLQACYTVPLGYSALLTQFCTSNIWTAAEKEIEFRIRRSISGAASRTTEKYTLSNATYACTLHDPPLMFSEKTDIELTADATGDNASASGTFDIVLVPN